MPRHMQRPRGWRMLAISAALGGSVAVAACSLAVATGLGVGGSVGGSMGGVVSGSVSTGTADVPTGGGPPAAAADQLIEAASAADAVLFAPVRKGVEHPRAASATAAAPAPPAPPAPAPPPAPPLVVRRTAVAAALPGGSLEQLSFPDPADRSRSERVLVWHPPGPDSSKLPVVYWLHGVPGRPEDFLGSGYLAAVAREVLAGQLAPVVIAMPDGNSARHSDTEWADSASGDQDLATLVAGQVVGAVEQGHPRPSSLRTLAGFSMGGYGAADIALHHPQVFGSVVCLEGYFHVDDPSDVLGRTTTALAAHTPTAELAALGNRPVFLADYANDTEPVVAGESQRMASLLAQRKATYQLVTVPGAGHGLAPLPGLWPDIERYLARTAWRQ